MDVADSLLDVQLDEYDYALDGDDSVLVEETPGEVDE